MHRPLAALVLLLALSVPAMCRRLSTGDVADLDHALTAEEHTPTAEEYPPTAEEHLALADYHEEQELAAAEHGVEDGATSYESKERYGFLPTPNIATPILSTVILPTTFSQSYLGTPDFLLPAFHPGPPPDSYWDEVHARARHKHHRKIKVSDDGTLWTKYPNMKHLVEIVPIKHRSNAKGKALAYIVPKSHSVKKKFKKQKRVSGIVVDRNMPDLSGSGSSEEYQSIDSSVSQSSDSEDDAMDSSSSDREDKLTEEVHTDDVEFRNAPDTPVVNYYNSISEDKINNKLNDIETYFNKHKDINLDSLIHDILPDDEANPEYHVHYIIHKKHQTNNRSASEDHTHHNNNVIHVNYNPNESNVNYKKIHLHPQFDDHAIGNTDENHHNQVIVKSNKDDSHENLIHYSHKTKEHNLEPYHNTFHSNQDLKHNVIHATFKSDTVPNHSHSTEDLGYIVPSDDNNSTPIEILEQLHDLMQDGDVESDFKQFYETLKPPIPQNVIQVYPSDEINNDEMKTGLEPLVNNDENPVIPRNIIHVYPPDDIKNDEIKPGHESLINYHGKLEIPQNIILANPPDDIENDEMKAGLESLVNNDEKPLNPRNIIHMYPPDEIKTDETKPGHDTLINHHEKLPPHENIIIHVYPPARIDKEATKPDHEGNPSISQNIMHVYPDGHDDSDQSDAAENQADSISSENYSDSSSNDGAGDESQTAGGLSGLKAQDLNSSMSQSSADSEHDSLENGLYHEESPEAARISYHDPTSAEDMLPELIHGHGIIDTSAQESTSKETVETNSSLQNDEDTEFTPVDLSGHDFIFPDCLKSKRKKAVKKCNNECTGRKSYTLTFLFNK